MFNLTADWETLPEGAAEEIACFAAVTIELNNVVISEGHDPFVSRVRKSPLLSAYHLAEWLAWNWWRLRWEPRGRSEDWRFAHAMTTIGEGYVWPGVTIFPDGERVTIASRPSDPAEEFAFRYINEFSGGISASEFEGACERFISQVLGQLDAEAIGESNLSRVWADIERERRDPALAVYRRLEATLGFEPDSGPEEMIRRLIADERLIGPDGALELAAENGKRVEPLFGSDLLQIAEDSGAEIDLRNVVRVHDRLVTARGDTPAWLVGQRAAHAVRDQIGNDNEPLNDGQLAELVAVDPKIIAASGNTAPLSFSIRDNLQRGKLVLRSRWDTGRRFDLARILGDVVASGHNGPLVPATRASTYRQKMQRSFAAELLSPFESVDAYLAGDYSDEHQEDVAAHFNVSPLTIRTMLVNHSRIDPGELANDAGHPVDGWEAVAAE